MIKLRAVIDPSDNLAELVDLEDFFSEVWNSLSSTTIKDVVVTGNFTDSDGTTYRELAFHPTARYTDEEGHRYLTDGNFTFSFTQFLDEARKVVSE